MRATAGAGALLRALILLIASCAGSAHAHHSAAMFDHQRSVELTGTVRLFQWTNPHCYIQLITKTATGEDEEWSIEMGAPMHLQGRGWTPRTLKPGDQVRVTIAPMRNDGKAGELRSITTLDGKPLGARP
jgi:hypothetical protein